MTTDFSRNAPLSVKLARAAEQEIAAERPDAVLVCNDSLDHGVELFRVAAESGRMVFRYGLDEARVRRYLTYS